MKKLICMVLFTLLSAPAFAQDRYISDELFTYMHSGPSSQYRIIGSINAGDKVTLISNDKETGFTQVVDSRGRKGWVQSRFVTNEVSMAIRMPRLEKELSEVKEKLANARQTSDSEKEGLANSLDMRNKRKLAVNTLLQ